MKNQSGAEWQKGHLKRQAFLFWLLSHHLITDALAEKIDENDNKDRKDKIS